MVLTSCAWAALTAFFYVNFVFFILTACEGAIFVGGVSFNIAILVNVKSQTKNSSAPHTALNVNLTKTISLIVGIILIMYIPLIVHLNIIQYVFRNCTNFSTILRVVCWSIIPSQSQDITRNSRIFITRNRRMKHYYHNLLNCRNNKE